MKDYKVLVTKYNSCTHCIFQELMWPEQYEEYGKSAQKQIKVISINLIEHAGKTKTKAGPAGSRPHKGRRIRLNRL